MGAGLGTRFGYHTEKIPKGFLLVSNKSMVLRSIEALIRCGIEHIYIGTGFKKEMYENLSAIYPQIECCYSPMYADTNSMYTLFNMRELIGQEDFLLLESDLVYEDKALTALIENQHDRVMLITNVTKFQDQYYVEYDENSYLKNCTTNKDEINPCGELVGIHKIDNKFYELMCDNYAQIKDESPKLGYEYQILSMSKQFPVYVLKVDDLKWYEIDDILDKEYAEQNIMKYID